MTSFQTIVSTLGNLAQTRLPAAVWRRDHPGAGDPSGRNRPSTRLSPDESGEYVPPEREPSLDEMLGDPIVQLVMRADRLEAADVRRALDAGRPPTQC